MNITEITKLGLWPQSKKTTTQKGIAELEDLGYNLFYIGKNADLYTCPGDEPKVLLVRSDRCSVFDIPLNLLIEGKGVSQTAISNNGASFAKEAGIRTAILSETVDSSLSIAPRCQLMELCKPLEAVVDGDLVQFELIFRNYLTGSLFDACQNGTDPYGLDLPWYLSGCRLGQCVVGALLGMGSERGMGTDYFPCVWCCIPWTRPALLPKPSILSPLPDSGLSHGSDDLFWSQLCTGRDAQLCEWVGGSVIQIVSCLRFAGNIHLTR